LPAKNIRLIILGDGLNREKLLQQVKGWSRRCSIVFRVAENPFKYMKKCKSLLF
jgi:hypothetical protein